MPLSLSSVCLNVPTPNPPTHVLISMKGSRVSNVYTRKTVSWLAMVVKHFTPKCMALFKMLFKKFQFSGTNWVSKKLTNGKNHNQTLVLWLQNTLVVITLELLILLVILVKYVKATKKPSKHVLVKLSGDQRKAK